MSGNIGGDSGGIARNGVANLAGMAISIGVQAALAFGGYRLAGAEQYGLIGFYTVLVMAAAVFDAGIGQTVTREVARNWRTAPDMAGAIVVNFLLVYLCLAAVLLFTVIFVSPLLARYWLRPEHITREQIETALMLMGVGLGIQRLRGLFQSTLEGMERQVLSNMLLASANLARLVLGLGSLVLVAPTAEAFFWGQIAASVFETGIFAFAVHRVLPTSFRFRRLEPQLVAQTARFALTNMAAAATGTLVNIADSLIVSAVLPLAVFGTYSLVATMCSAMVRLTTPLITATFPRMAAYVAGGEFGQLRTLFYTMSQATFVLMLTATAALIFYGEGFLQLITGDVARATAFAPVLAVLAFAYALGGLSRPSHALQMSEGDAGTALKINVITGLVYLPAIFFLTPIYGVIAPDRKSVV